MQSLTILIYHKIYTLRGRQIMLDEDLAELYQVTTKRLNEQVKRNIERFPDDFMFQLAEAEYENLKSQFATSNFQERKNSNSLRSQYATLEENGRGKHRKYLPYAFTENGVYMLSAVLKSKIAIEVSIEIMRTFTKLREFSLHYNALAKQLVELERKNSREFQKLYQILNELISDTKATDEKVMGFLRGGE